MYYEDFYEPSEYDQMVEEFKEKLRESVKKEWLDRMNKLEEENQKLQEVKKNFNSIKKDYENKIRECEAEKNRVIVNAKREAHKERLSELFKDVQLNYWKITARHIKKPKCDKCDIYRRIKYISPMGREATEYCSCNDDEIRYIPEQMDMYEIKLKNTYDEKAQIWFIKKYKDDDDLFVNSAEYLGNKVIIEDSANFDEISADNKYNLYFKSIEKCREFCDYLNSLEQGGAENGEE